jgi:hypothetical protein
MPLMGQKHSLQPDSAKGSLLLLTPQECAVKCKGTGEAGMGLTLLAVRS